MTEKTHKTCSKCKTEKPLTEFYKRSRSYTAWCKDCMKELSRQRVFDGRDKVSKIKYELKNGHDRKNPKPKREPHNKGVRHVSDLHKMVKEMHRNMKKRAIFSNLEIEITFEELLKMVEDFCNSNYHIISTKKHPFKPSIDRIDPQKGYTKENTKICWMIENLCKNTFTENDVIEFCKRKLNLL